MKGVGTKRDLRLSSNMEIPISRAGSVPVPSEHTGISASFVLDLGIFKGYE